MSEEMLDIVKAEEEKGKIVFHTIDGIVTANVEEIIQQPVEGLLYDLNRDKVTCAHFIASDEDNSSPWLNNYAAAVIIEKLHKIYQEHK